MNKWYKTSWIKGVLTAVVILAAGGILAGMYTAVRILPTDNVSQLFGQYEEEYLDTNTFENNFHIASMTVLKSLRDKNSFETDGKYDEEKQIDIEMYLENKVADGKTPSGFAYRLGDLVKWSEEYSSEGPEYLEPFVVCKRPDETYYYYRMSEFEELLEKREILLADIGSISGFLKDLREGEYIVGAGTELTDVQGNTIYTDCWTFEAAWKEEFSPIGFNSILDIVNTDPYWNGRLSEMYDMLGSVLDSFYYEVSSYLMQDDAYQEGNTNFSYMLVDLKNQKLWSNKKEWSSFEHYEDYLKELQKGEDKYKYCVIQEKLKDCKSNLEGFNAGEWKSAVSTTSGNGGDMKNCVFAAAVDRTIPIPDDFQWAAKEYQNSIRFLPLVKIGVFLAGFLWIAAVLWLTIIAGRKPSDEELHLNSFDRIPTEAAAIGVVAAWIIGSFAIYNSGILSTGSVYYESSFGYYVLELSGQEVLGIIGAVMLGVWTGICFLIGYLSLIRRIKGRELWMNSILRRVLKFTRYVWENRSAVTRVLLICIGFCFIHWIAMLVNCYDISPAHWLAFFAEIALTVWLLKSAIAKDRIRKGVREIEEGNLDYQIEETGLSGDYAKMAERINHIGDGLQKAVEKSMKDERLKTDLITNVSHDIKTPLTSIINYVDLLKREHFADPKVQNYLDILDKKSQRLKQLTEDVVEASKVSSGNITLECMDLNLVEMINQTEGEFEEKFAAKNLQPVLNLPEGDAVIHADGRRMWRVLENIYNNAAKYAMPGTRIYADLSTNEKEVVFSLKNVSEHPLNISADELTERFIRGDISRSTEGSGLGLSIAKSLTVLQGGTFHLYLDGDLFRVTITFPRVR